MYQTLKWTQYKKDFDVFDIDQIRERFTEADDANRTLYKTNLEHYKQMLDLAITVYGSDSTPYIYLIRHHPPMPPDLNPEFRKLEKNYTAYTEAEKRKQKQRQRRLDRQKEIEQAKEEQREKDRDYRQRSKEANTKLEEMGYTPYEDFQPTRAITFLKKIKATQRHQQKFDDALDTATQMINRYYPNIETEIIVSEIFGNKAIGVGIIMNKESIGNINILHESIESESKQHLSESMADLIRIGIEHHHYRIEQFKRI